MDPDLKNRSNSRAFDESSSTRVILNISEVQCKDDGQYRCTVDHVDLNSGTGLKTCTNTTVYIQGKDVL